MRIIGGPLTVEESAAVLETVRGFHTQKTRFGRRGRSDKKLDCVGLWVVPFQRIGRTVQDQPDYSNNPTGNLLRQAVEAHLGPPVDEIQVGDFLLMAVKSPDPNHVAMVTGWDKDGLLITHACAAFRKVVEHHLSDEWLDRIVAVYRP